jgi:A/G-specific adenine glycosylase
MPRKTNDFPAKLTRFHRALAGWYALHGRRDLPWRNTRDPYAVYISEIMLQQTQVKIVLDRYYTPFLKRFPSLRALAEAPQEAVVKQWEGLGYYTRARNLHAAAQASKGVLPGSPEALMELPGIGRNTANAIACFGFGASVPVMEANVRRVLCRVFALRKADENVLWEKAHLLLDGKNAFDYNQAMMDIGAMVCTKRKPRCSECPLAELCEGKTSPESYPEPKKAKITPVRKRVIVVFGVERRYALQLRATRFLGGLYGFMEYDTADAVRFMGKLYALRTERLIGGVTQTYSHFSLEAKVYLVPMSAQRAPDTGVVMATLDEMAHLPLSRADHKIVKLLAEHESVPD